ncbi:MAG TPA: DUF4340 domain-containing protein [Xanthobacteraceae bacterium]|jgi:hypothetical protein
MINARHLSFLAGLAVTSVAVAAFVLQGSALTVASDRRGERVLPGLADNANQITGLTVRKDADTLSMERRDAGFVAADSGFPVKTDAVRDLLASSLELTFEEGRTTDASRYGDLGLADPGQPNGGTEVALRTASGDVADFIVGNHDGTVGGPVGGEFIRLKDAPQTWLVRGNVRLPSGRSDWFEAFDFGVKRSEIHKIEVSGGARDAVTVTAVADKPGEFTLENVPEKRVEDTYKVSRLTSPIESFRFEDVRKATKLPDDPRRLVADVGDGLRISLTSAGEPSDGWVQIGVEAMSDGARDKAKAIAAKADGFDFRLPSTEAEVLGWTNHELSNEQKG